MNTLVPATYDCNFQSHSKSLFSCTNRPLKNRRNATRQFQVAVEARRGKHWWSDSWDISSSSPKPEEEVITVFGTDGTVTTVNGNPAALRLREHHTKNSHNPLQLPTPQEQGLCIGSIFSITATNGVDVSRRMNVLGFCQSVEALHDAVERKVAQRGGEIFRVKRDLKSGVHETLTMALALPLLWGVPPEHENLKYGIESGGGIIDRIYQEFFIFSSGKL